MVLLLLGLLCDDLEEFEEVRLLLGVTSSISTSIVLLELWWRVLNFVVLWLQPWFLIGVVNKSILSLQLWSVVEIYG